MTRNSTHPPSTTLSRERTSVTFWGVRGSLAAPGEATRRIGGNTSCLGLRNGASSLIFGAGTALRWCREAPGLTVRRGGQGGRRRSAGRSLPASD